MTSDLANKAEQTARQMRFQQSKDHKSQGPAKLTYESVVGFNFDYPKNIFLVNKNMHLNRGLEDMSYDIYKFEESGKYKKVPTEDFGVDFFNKLKVIKKI